MKTMRKNIPSTLLWGGLALMLTAGLIAWTTPEKVMIFFTPYNGSMYLLSKTLAIIGGLTASLGYLTRLRR
jgi:hypothetical protein